MGFFDLFNSKNKATKENLGGVNKGHQTLDISNDASTSKTEQSYNPMLWGGFNEDFSFLQKNVFTAKKIEVIDTAISYIARWFSQGILKAYDSNGNEIESTPLLEKLKNPNQLQSQFEFLSQWAYFTKANGKSFIKPYTKSIGFEKDIERTDLHNLNPDFIKEFKNTKSIFKASKKDDFFVFEEKIKAGYSQITIKHKFFYSDAIVFSDNINTNNQTSVLASLQDEVKNIYLAQKGKFNKLEHSGVIVVSPKNTEAKESLGLDKPVTGKSPELTQKQIIEERLNTSGNTSDGGVIVVGTGLNAQNLTEGLNSLDYDKEVIEDYRRVFKKFGISDELSEISQKEKSNSSLGDSGNKKEVALLQFLQNTIEPLGDLFAGTITSFYDDGITYKMEYNHLTPYQIVESKKTEQNKTKVELIALLKNEELISIDEAKDIIKTLAL